jgi:xylulokinase
VLGSAILAGYAAGVFDDMAETSQSFIQMTTRVEPIMENHKYYQALLKEYIELFEATKPIFDALAVVPEATI